MACFSLNLDLQRQGRSLYRLLYVFICVRGWGEGRGQKWGWVDGGVRVGGGREPRNLAAGTVR